MSNRNDMLTRLSTLERELRWWRRLGVATLAVAILTTCVAANGEPEVPELIKAKEFQLIGDEGQVVATLETAGPMTRLRISHKTGAPGLVLGVNSDSSGLYLDTDGNKSMVNIEASSEGEHVWLRKIGNPTEWVTVESGAKGTHIEMSANGRQTKLKP